MQEPLPSFSAVQSPSSPFPSPLARIYFSALASFARRRTFNTLEVEEILVGEKFLSFQFLEGERVGVKGRVGFVGRKWGAHNKFPISAPPPALSSECVGEIGNAFAGCMLCFGIPVFSCPFSLPLYPFFRPLTYPFIYLSFNLLFSHILFYLSLLFSFECVQIGNAFARCPALSWHLCFRLPSPPLYLYFILSSMLLSTALRTFQDLFIKEVIWHGISIYVIKFIPTSWRSSSDTLVSTRPREQK